MNNDKRQPGAWRSSLLALAVALVLAACARSTPPPEEVRPVRFLTVDGADVELQDTYAGEVQPRYESNLGFRVAGKIQQRLVNVGDTVQSGQVLAKLDADDLSLSAASSRANLAAQRAQLLVQRTELDRDRQELTDQDISQSAYDHQLSAFQAAQAQFDAAQAQSRQSRNQVGYALLRADHAGVIGAIEAEAGQVVAAGQTVAQLAWSGETEIAVNVPENQVQNIVLGMPVQVRLWASAAQAYTGKVRELASTADPATRTYAMRVAVPDAPADMRLGMTASVSMQRALGAKLIRLPLPALVEVQGRQGVWVIDPKTQTVQFRQTQVAGISGNDLLVAQGLQQGDKVITAGAALLHAGQKVRPLARDSAAEH